jgi:hypothetical protein
MTSDERKKLYAALSAPFGEEAIERTEGRVTGRGYDTTGIKYQFIVNRLNEVLGIGCWRTEQVINLRETTTSKGRAAFDATCNLTLRFGVWEAGTFLPWAEAFATGGHQSLSEADARKGAFTNGLKKAAAMVGCGKQAYEGTLDDDAVPAEASREYAPSARPPATTRPAAPRPQPIRTQEPAPRVAQPRLVDPEVTSASSARTPVSTPQDDGPRATPKQLAVIWSCMRKLGFEEREFRQHVTTKFGAEPEQLGTKLASELIGQLTAKANGGRSKAGARA